MTPEINAEYVESFGLVGKDNDGQITKAEFESMIRKTGMANYKKMSDKLWTNSGAGSTMNLEQYKKAFLETFVIMNKKAQILAAFEIFDAEKTGKIHQEEINLIFSQMGNQLDSEEIKDLIKLLNPDSEGKCDYRIFVDNMFTACREA